MTTRLTICALAFLIVSGTAKPAVAQQCGGPKCNSTHTGCEFSGASSQRDCCCNVSCDGSGCTCTTSCSTSCSFRVQAARRAQALRLARASN
jgi:hypothetical protein